MSKEPELLRVQRTEDVVEAMQHAVATQGRVRVRGGNSKHSLLPTSLSPSPVHGRGAGERAARPSEHAVTLQGAPVPPASRAGGLTVLDLSAYSGITAYEPGELVLTLRAGTPLAEVEATLAARNQMLAFEPPDYARLLGAAPGSSTLGGVIASGLAGPRRLGAGNVRDHLLGFAAVSGRGEAFKAGGRVMKNVTGYDLSKLVCGSWGTLAALTELSLRVLPRPEAEASLVVHGLDAPAAVSLMNRALSTPLEVSCAAFVAGATVLRLEGFAASVAERLRLLPAALGGTLALSRMEQDDSAAWWRAQRNLDRHVDDARILWRLSLPSSASAAVAQGLVETLGGEASYDWGGSLVWLALDSSREAAADTVRAAVEQAGGHALLLRAPPSLRERAPLLHPAAPGIAALGRRVKQGFDPHQVLPDLP